MKKCRRMRGGAGEISPVNPMVAQGIRSAARHGIQLVHGRPNKASGNCSIESVIYNVNDREHFTEGQKTLQDPQEARELWVTELQTAMEAH